MGKLFDKTVKAIEKPGRHSDGNGLYLRVKATGGKSWSYMWKRDGYQREIGLGAYPSVSLKLAREKATIAREAVSIGQNPKLALNPPQSQTFEDVAKACMVSRDVAKLSPKTIRKWERTAFELCRGLKNRPIESITRDDIISIIEPVWKRTPETGRIMRSQLEIIFNYAKGRRWMETENPAAWKGGLEAILKPIDRKNVKHHRAMDYNDIPVFISELRSREAVSARAMEFLILTATRTSETIAATFEEFDLENRIWSIDAKRMKSGRPHKIPLSGRAVEIIGECKALARSQYLFSGQRGSHLSNMAMLILLKKRMGYNDLTVHGFRSTFRDWAGDCTTYPREIAEAALAHSVGNAVERSYRRRDALDRRRELMNMWADYCDGKSSGEVVRLHG